MEKPKKHPELPKSTALIKLPEGSDEYRDISKSVKHSDFKIYIRRPYFTTVFWSLKIKKEL
jgi:hypothetical protein